jgi:nucleoside-diphosphate-sugar epimerase
VTLKIFVTGATGYIGGSVAERLVRDGHAVTGLTRSEEGARELEQRSIRPVIGTLDDAATVTKAAQDADAAIGFKAHSSFDSNSRVRGKRSRAELGWQPKGVPMLQDIEHGWYRRVHRP